MVTIGDRTDGAGAQPGVENGSSVWTGHTDGRVAQWNPKRAGAELIRGPWIAHTDRRWVTAIESARDGPAVVVWVGFEDGLMIAYDASTAAVLRKCKAHHSGVAAISSFSAQPDRSGVVQKLVTASSKGTLRSWNAVDCAPSAAKAKGASGAAGAQRAPRPEFGRGLYGGVEYVEYRTPARHAFGRRCSTHLPTDQPVTNPDEPVTVDVVLHVYDLGLAAESKGFRALKAINTQVIYRKHLALQPEQVVSLRVAAFIRAEEMSRSYVDYGVRCALASAYPGAWCFPRRGRDIWLGMVVWMER
eukprot:COSAG02_NODE_353_length_24023_cov_77.872304_22_plen_302_part_00